jgi:hypothetical protein
VSFIPIGSTRGVSPSYFVGTESAIFEVGGDFSVSEVTCRPDILTRSFDQPDSITRTSTNSILFAAEIADRRGRTDLPGVHGDQIVFARVDGFESEWSEDLGTTYSGMKFELRSSELIWMRSGCTDDLGFFLWNDGWTFWHLETEFADYGVLLIGLLRQGLIDCEIKSTPRCEIVSRGVLPVVGSSDSYVHVCAGAVHIFSPYSSGSTVIHNELIDAKTQVGTTPNGRTVLVAKGQLFVYNNDFSVEYFDRDLSAGLLLSLESELCWLDSNLVITRFGPIIG